MGIVLGGDASLSAEFSIGLADPSDTGHDGPDGANKNGPADDGKVSLTEIIKGLSTPSVLLAQPTLTGGGSAFLTIDVEGVPFIVVPDPGMPDAPKITIDVLGTWATCSTRTPTWSI